MKATDGLRAALYPLTAPAVLVPLIVFWLLIALAMATGLLGLWLLIVIVPAVFRFLGGGDCGYSYDGKACECQNGF